MAGDKKRLLRVLSKRGEIVSIDIEDGALHPTSPRYDLEYANRIELYSVNQSGELLLLLDIIPRTDTEVKLENHNKRLKLTGFIRCLVNRDTDLRFASERRPYVKMDCTLELFDPGEQIKLTALQFDEDLNWMQGANLTQLGWTSLPIPLEEIQDKPWRIARVAPPYLAALLGLPVQSPARIPGAPLFIDWQDQLGHLVVSFKSKSQCETEHVELPQEPLPLVIHFERKVALDTGPDSTRLKVAGPAPLGNISFSKNQVRAADLGDKANLRVTLIQRQSMSLNQASPMGEWILKLDKALPNTAILNLWNTAIAASYLNALNTVQDGRPVSVLPLLEGKDAPLLRVATSWGMVLKVCDQLFDKNIDSREDIVFDEERCLDRKVSIKALALYPPNNAEVNLTLRNFLTYDQSKGLKLDGLLVNLQYDPHSFLKEKTPETRSPFRFGLYPLSNSQANDEQYCRLGALDLTFPPSVSNFEAERDIDRRWQVSASLRRPKPNDPQNASLLKIIIDNACLPVRRVVPGGQDALPGEEFVPSNFTSEAQRENDPASTTEREIEQGFEREAPLIIPLNQDAASTAARFLLRISEHTEELNSQTLQILLQEPPASPATESANPSTTQSIIVLDKEPFLVAMVNAPAFQAQGDLRSIGTWSDKDLLWELSGSGDGFDLLLPPQGIGEAMEKNKTPPPPAGTETPDQRAERLALIDIEENKPIDFRFSPHAKLTLFPSFFKQRFAEAPWNLRRILGFPGQRAPGAGVKKLDFELLYGLGCTVDYEFLRLAEITSLLGRVVERLPANINWVRGADINQQRIYQNFRLQWSKIYERVSSRLAVLEPWDTHLVRDPNQRKPLLLSDGLQYELRKNAHLRYPVLLPQNVNEKRRIQEEIDKLHIPNEAEGLAGGLAWGFESANIYNALWRNRKSVQGSAINSLYFSALGGWGNQKASFDNGLTTIYADVSMGRTYYYSIERIGRIGVFWNLAKHVIVYKRTVVPSPQFNNSDPQFNQFDQQDDLVGRTVLRKVEEYVQIIQDKRKFPEFGAAPVTRGCITGIEFKDKKILVNSHWGGDVRNEGWQVPLWQPNLPAGQQAVYKKPHIVLEIATDPESGAPTDSVVIEEPEKLTFFTRTVEGTDTHTDRWVAVKDIDYIDHPKPKPPETAAFDNADMDKLLPNPSAIEPGFGQFTYAIAPAARPANLVVERAENSLNAVLRNVTMMRAKATSGTSAPAPVNQALQSLGEVRDRIDNIFDAVLAKLPAQGRFTSEINKEVSQLLHQLKIPSEPGIISELGKIKDALQQVKAASSLPLFRDRDALCKQLTSSSDAALELAKNRVLQVITKARDEFDKQFANLQAEETSLKNTAKATIDKIFRQAEGSFAPINSGLEALLNDSFAVVEQIIEEIRHFQSAAIAKLTQLLDIAEHSSDDFAEFRRRLKGFQKEVRDKIREIEQKAASSLKGRFSEIAQGILSNIKTFEQNLEDKLEAVEEAIASGLASIRVKLNEGKTLVNEAVDTLIGKLEGIQPLRAVIESQLETLGLKNLNTKLVSLRKSLFQKIDSFQDGLPLAELKMKIDAEITAEITTFKTKVEGLKSQVRNFIERKMCPVLGNELDEFGKKLEDLFDASEAKNFINQLEKRLQEANQTYDGFRHDIENIRDKVHNQVAPYIERVNEVLPKVSGVIGALSQLPDNTLRLIRAFGDVPRVPNLGFNRDTLAYFFDEDKKAVLTTPVTGLVNRTRDNLGRIEDNLKALGIRVPTSQLLDRIIPNSLEHFDLSKIFPDFAGLKLTRLFPGLKMPAIANNNVKVTHGLDKQAMRAWLRAEVNVPIGEPATIFSFGPLTLRLLQAQFQAFSLVEAGLAGPPKLKTSGSISGNWELQVGGTQLVTFRDTKLTFDENGRLRFSLSPEKIEMSGILKFLSDLVASLSSPENGFYIRLITINGTPVGVEATLDLPLPDVSLGAFGMANLRFGAGVKLLAAPKPEGGVDFVIGLGLNFGGKTAPFVLTIFVLTGGGWFDVRAQYAPLTGRVSTALTIGIAAGARLAFAFGPLRGSVSILFGISVEFFAESGGSGTSITLMLLIQGEIQVLSFISVTLTLLLEAQYKQGRLIGRGSVQLKIKICWCFTLTVSASVEYQFAGGSSSRSAGASAAIVAPPAANAEALDDESPAALIAPPEDPYEKAANQYVGMFE
jgi:hypothetical protein